MDIKLSASFRADKKAKLYHFLVDNNIEFITNEVGFSTFEIDAVHPQWDNLNRILDELKIYKDIETHYSKEEFDGAQWLRIRSQWKSGYPQPEGKFDYENITYTRQDKCNVCGCGLVQVNPFRMKKAPKWGRRHFMELNWIGDELFVDDTVRSVLELNQISGVSFMSVFDKKGQKELESIHQIVIPTLFDKGMLESPKSFKAIEQCQYCGEKKFVYSGWGMLSFKKDIFEGAPEIVKIAEYFGSGCYAQRMIIVNQRVYQLITKNKLDAALVFEPINLV